MLDAVADNAAASGAGKTVGDVLSDGEVREQRAVLRDVSDAAPMRCHRALRACHLSTGDGDRSGVGGFEAGDEPQQRGLAAA